ncbi:Putative branched-chain amino acid ABC transporter, permease protein [Hyphomicrobium sp. GJ21]|jgi:urea transport system permease protein|uniref:urea ABC transporter permease subunit UrtC n=1 Tax=Hyphomicrobium sp. GJ21 TaxID=113574 RepID=UPI000622BE4E|nr:urea ABC transporter permease subunit UrtC [Hyphomicrobium sp. GJ21]CEJ88175.1 Putative branched-chain amino acid ABC transporter, permease protein [Hyphomicrobium sp. GJ21]
MKERADNVPGNIYHNRKAQWAAYLALFAALALLPLIAGDSFVLNQLARYAALAMLAVSVSFVWGYGGILSLGQGIAFGIAAYGMAMTMQMQSQDPVSAPIPSFMLTNGIETLPWLWAPFWSTPVGLILTLAVPTLFFIGFGAMMFQARVAGVFVAIMTLAMLAALYSMAYDMQPYTAGFNGITPPAPFVFMGITFDPYGTTAYYLCIAILAFVTLSAKALLQSKFGTIVQAIRDDAERVRFLGYNVAYYQVVVFAISGLIAAFGGLCWVLIVQYVSPTSFEITLSISAVIWAAVGGRMSLFGAIVGAFLINGMQSYLGDELQQIWLIILGAAFIGVVLFLPNGIAGVIERVLEGVKPNRETSSDRQLASIGDSVKESV